jgi:P-type E1-E2 ATPase
MVNNQERRVFDLLEVFPFTSDRKRMSVVVRTQGMIKMYMKGADSIVKARLSKDNKLNLDDELGRFSRIGLRTLLIGMRVISEN